MIRNSFIILEKISKTKEKKIWKQGIRNWEEFVKVKNVKGIASEKKKYYDRKIKDARKKLYSGESSYFVDLIPLSETWRLYKFFREETVFLDIETTGIREHCEINVIGLFDGIKTKTMIKGVNLDIPILRRELQQYKMIATFNGNTFDLPYIKKRYPDLLPKVPCFDIRHAGAKIGLQFGLKKIEKQLGIQRTNPIIENLHGGDAATLYRMFKGSGDQRYLDLLVEYNEEDVINLQKIADYVYKQLEQLIISSQ